MIKSLTDFRPNTRNDLKTDSMQSHFAQCFIQAELNTLLHEILDSGSAFQFSGLSLILFRTELGYAETFFFLFLS